MNQLTGKVALVTGGGNGIGRGIALRLAKEGAAVGVLDRDAAACHQTVEFITGSGERALALPGDVSNSESVRHAVRELTTTFGLSNILVHTAGVMPTGIIEKTSEEDWDRVYDVNVKGAYLTCREMTPLMRQGGGVPLFWLRRSRASTAFPGWLRTPGPRGH